MQNSQPSFAALKIIHRTLLIGQALFMVVLFYLVYSKTITPAITGKDNILQAIAIAVAVIAFFAGTRLFKKRTELIRNDSGLALKQKFEKYIAAFTTQWALLEGACLFSCIIFFITSNYFFLALAATVTVVFITKAPSKSKMAEDIGLDSTEADSL